MNILMLTLMYPNDQLDEVVQKAKDKLQNQINNYQRAFLEGIQQNMQKGERLDVINSLPVGIFPFQYRQLFLRPGVHDGQSIRQLGCINLPWFKQKMRSRAAKKEIVRWAKSDPQNRCLLLYTQYLPYMEAVKKAKKQIPNLKAAVIVTDLPNDFGLSSGRTGLLKAIEYHRGEKSIELCRQMDGFVLLTEPMAEVLPIENKPYVVIEGLITEGSALEAEIEKPAVLYTGTLERDLGIGELLHAFEKMPEYELWICGHGGMKEEIEACAKKHPNIRFFGFVSQNEAIALQTQATALINPRSSQGAFTRYSFPSKTLEYLRSGKPVLCYKLEGIPDEYDPYLNYIPENGSEGIRQVVKHIMALSKEERTAIGKKGRQYVLDQKNPAKQCARLVRLLREL